MARRPGSPAATAVLIAAVGGPLLRTLPGRVVADTKQYLYVDPARFLPRVVHLWDPGFALGTVTHQTIGYLFPMGPFFWAADVVGIADWVAQRVWLTIIISGAAGGVVYLGRSLGWRGLAPAVAGALYALSPYALPYATRISALLLPWAGLPWMLALTIRSVRRGGWRYPALFALVVLTVGSINASSLIYVGVAPVLWLVFAVAVHGEIRLRTAVATAARIGILTAGVSMWWVAGLIVQGRYGPPVLAMSETLDAVASGSSAAEVARGLGYWLAYGGDKAGPWVSAAVPYTQNPALIVVGFALAAVAVAALFSIRWRYRAFTVTMTVTGLVLATGLHPWERPSPLMAALRAVVAPDSDLALSMRSYTRAAPLYLLGLAMAVGAAGSALSEHLHARSGRRGRRFGIVIGAALCALVAAGIPVLWTGRYVGPELARPERLPGFWTEAAAWLDARGDGTRVVAFPGADFSAHRWGNTIDHVAVGLMDRPFAVRELIGLGMPAANDLLIAVDRRFQEDLLEPDALAPLARLLSAGHVVIQSDLEYERYRLPRPRLVWDALTPTPDGLADPVAFGEGYVNRPSPRLPLLDELELGAPADLEDPPAVAVFGVPGAEPIVRTVDARHPLVVSGDGEGLAELAAVGMLEGDPLVLYSASLADDEIGPLVVDTGADLVVTDANRRRARRWRTVRDNTGYTERPGEEPLRRDLADERIRVFEDPPADAFTVADTGGVTVRATAYGNPVTYTPEDRPNNALDGDLRTAWRVGAFSEVVGERLRIDFEEPRRVPGLRLLQPQTGVRNRHITEVRIRTAEGTLTVPLDDRSLTPPGQDVPLGVTTTFVDIEITADSAGPRPTYDGLSPVGFAEVGLAPLDEVIVMPTDLVRRVGRRSADHRLTYVMTRERVDPRNAVRDDPEPAMVRRFTVPTPRSFRLGGTARLSGRVGGALIDDLLGVPPGVRVTESRILPGSVWARGSAALDGDPTTAWMPGFTHPAGEWLEITADEPFTVDGMSLVIRADGRHSVPTALRLETAEGVTHEVRLPPVEDRPTPDATVTLEVPTPTLRTARLRVTVAEVRAVTTTDWFTESPIELPVAIAELGIAGLRRGQPPALMPAPCRDDLVTIDGRPVPVKVVGATDRASRRGPLTVIACDLAPVELGAGTHVLRTAAGWDTGIDIDRLVLSSAPGGGAGLPVGPRSRPGPTVEVADDDRSAVTVRLGASTAPFWLVLSQGHSPGWRATVDARDLGAARLVGGYANGWLVTDNVADGTVVRLDFGPQRVVWTGLGISGVAVLAALVMIVTRSRPGPDRRRRPPRWAPPESPVFAPVSVAVVDLRTRSLLTAGLVGGITAGALTRPWWALAGAALTVAGLGHRRGKAVTGLVAVTALGAAGVVTAASVVVNRWPHALGWPRFIPWAHELGWVALAALVADATASCVRCRTAPRRD